MIVLHDGAMHPLETAKAAEEYIAEFEAAHGLADRARNRHMLTKEAARAMVLEHINRDFHEAGDSLVVDEGTITKDYGWIFFYTSRMWRERGDFRHAIGGNGPIVCEKNGTLCQLGTAHSSADEIRDYEARRR